jgi:copper chaperone NosL
MKNKLGALTKLLLLIAAVGLVAVLFLPIWRIDLDAPQYPEGLRLTIHANGLKGNVDIINGLNHYIGMKTLHSEDFIEFTVLPYIIVFFALAFLVVAFINSRRWLNVLFVSFVLFAIAAMYDFWRWEYDYGHNLDPNAAIVVPGMAYQPPLIGFKQLLNFGAYSIPDTGGWLFIGAGLLLLAAVVIEWKRNQVFKKKIMVNTVAALLLLPFLLNSCGVGPEKIVVGSDHCTYCKMTITDNRYSAEIVTKKGKLYKFDDLHCLFAFTGAKGVDDGQVKEIYLSDFSGDHSLVKASESYLLQGGSIDGPMNGNLIAFKNKDSLQKIAAQLNAVEITWEQARK